MRAELFSRYPKLIKRIDWLQEDVGVDYLFLKAKLILVDESILHVTETWIGNELSKYSYYWLDSQNNLIIGWDNVPHHRHLENFPHHKHVGTQTNVATSQEQSLEDVLSLIEKIIC